MKSLGVLKLEREKPPNWWTIISEMRDYLHECYAKYSSAEGGKLSCAEEKAEIYYDLGEMLEDAIERVIQLNPSLKDQEVQL